MTDRNRQQSFVEAAAQLVEVAARLRALRLKRRLSMAGLAARAGLSRTTVSQALNGTGLPSEATVAALARALGVDAGPLLRLRAEALPPSARAPGAGPQEPFDAWYRKYVEERHGRLSVIGLDLSRPDRACWPLDAAYLSLEFSTAAHGIAPEGGPDAGPQVRVERAEQALAGRRRMLIRGLAGSGKTTLLQWLAVATARRRLPAELAHLADCVPFVLPLRTLVRRGELPAAQDFLAAAGCPRAGAQPDGWADRALTEGRALLLVDGLDEVPQAQRARTGEWLRELLAAYPDASYVITTRPSAVPEGWLADGGFTELAVRPMGARDVAVFVERWHRAAALAGTAQDQDQLPVLQEALQDTVRSQRDLAQLATTPLLCALVCALHRDRRGHLPHGRMELYEAALSMLLHRRDQERDIGTPEGIALSTHHSVQLLQRLAYWLVRNGQTELEYAMARDLVEDALPAMPQVARQADADADAVLTHLLARCGLLRQPTAETIDFVHRTFQDYLGAKAAVEARDIPLLVRNAHDDQWEDVIRMAVAHARPAERAGLLRRLIARGDRTARHRTRLHLLATACLEHATELDPAVREEVEGRAAALLPPRSVDEARALAAVGPVILDLLPGPERLEDDEAQAVVRTAGFVGGDAALTVMKRFLGHPEPSVAWAMHVSWDRFDASDYAREILYRAGSSRLIVRTPEQLDLVAGLPTPDALVLYGDHGVHAIAHAVDTSSVRSLDLNDNTTLDRLDFLTSWKRLSYLGLRNCPGVVDLTCLAESAVTNLHLYDAQARLEGLRHHTGLTHLGLHRPLSAREFTTLHLDATLRGLTLGSGASRELTSLAGVERWPSLTTLNLYGHFDDLSPAATLPNLDDLVLQLGAGAHMLANVPPLPTVRRLWLGTVDGDDDLAHVAAACPGLTRLQIVCQSKTRHVDLTPVRHLPDLTVEISDAREVTGAEHFPPDRIIRKPRPRT
ncbi:NACHT domain-containing protein [Streptomyces sp. NPDC050085]|uniref:NACHT domain-containing protein n=1 Tax=Streptomyces sp. NPDC050085 TaxID=3365600 RepID=UPI0037AB6FFA